MTATAKQNVATRGPSTAAELKARVHTWAETIGVTPRRIQVQRMRRKWASCSPAGTITLSADVLVESVAFQDFVIVHELLHLLVPNHGRVFRGLMRAYLPEWERAAAGRAGRNCGFQLVPRETVSLQAQSRRS